MHSARQVVLHAFDRLFEKAANKLDVNYSSEELADARHGFEERYRGVLEAIGSVDLDEVPPTVIEELEEAIDNLSPAQVVGQLATIPLMHKVQEVMRGLARRAAEQRLLEHYMTQAEDRYGGN